MEIQLAVGSWVDLWEMDLTNKENKDEPSSPRYKFPLLFEKGMSISGIVEALSNRETIVIDDKEIPIVFDAESVALDLLYHYVVRQNVPEINILTHYKYKPIIDIIGFQNALQCIVTTVAKTNNDQEFVVRVDKNLYQSLLSILKSLSEQSP